MFDMNELNKIVESFDHNTSKFKIYNFILNPVDFPGAIGQYYQSVTELRARKHRLEEEQINLKEIKIDIDEAAKRLDETTDPFDIRRLEVTKERAELMARRSEETIRMLVKEIQHFIDFSNEAYDKIDESFKRQDGSIDKERLDSVFWVVKQAIAQISNGPLPFGFEILPEETARNIAAEAINKSLGVRSKSLLQEGPKKIEE